MTKSVHFIGGGQMAEAIIRAIVNNHVYPPGSITVADINEKRVAYLQEKYRIESGQEQEKAISSAKLIVIAVRPQDDLYSVGKLIKEHAHQNATIISIVAGVTINRLTQLVGGNRPIVRIIPNTLTDTGYGYSGVALNELAKKEDIEDFLNGFGKVKYIDESLIDLFTGFGVCGPNYIYYFIESFVDGGVLAGLPRDLAWDVALENMIGSVEMLKKSGLHPRQLLDINNSPGGVGMNALFELNNSDFAAGLQRSIKRACERTTELGGE